MPKTETMPKRVWDSFLTAQDKQHGRKCAVGVGHRPAVINIDLYRAVFGDENVPLLEGIEKWPSYCGPSGVGGCAVYSAPDGQGASRGCARDPYYGP